MNRVDQIKVIQNKGYIELSINKAIRRRYSWAVWTFKIKGKWEFVKNPSYLEKLYQLHKNGEKV